MTLDATTRARVLVAGLGLVVMSLTLPVPAHALPFMKKKAKHVATAADSAKAAQSDSIAAVRRAKHPEQLTGPWRRGSQWGTVRLGAAKNNENNAPNAMIGYGVGYTRFIRTNWAVGAFLHHDLLGKFGGAAQIEMPITLEIVRHFGRKESLRSYLGFGAGLYRRRLFRTGADVSETKSGGYVTLGMNAPISAHQLLGFDLRGAVVNGDNKIDDPVFGKEAASELHTSFKVGYSRQF